ncbi:MAG: hypothetical protein HC936_02855 [Leptolyngbyaceae cyanobacterium SU_3_3]|nr:hypothetical protein [Leptolyngbyaceae cyanobacterium SU_3_3]
MFYFNDRRVSNAAEVVYYSSNFSGRSRPIKCSVTENAEISAIAILNMAIAEII